MFNPVEVSIKKIVVKRKYFPRFRIEKSRVEEFREAMRDGEHIPPILVANDGDRYVVIEGVHRLTAAKLERAKEIEVTFWPERNSDMWLLDAARLNDKTRKSLKAEEVKEVIRRKWREGWRSTKEIAHKIGRKESFVKRALKPLRDEERSKRNALICHLAKEGHTQQEIASKVGISRRTVSYVLAINDSVSFIAKPANTSNSQQLDQAQELNIYPVMLSNHSDCDHRDQPSVDNNCDEENPNIGKRTNNVSPNKSNFDVEVESPEFLPTMDESCNGLDCEEHNDSAIPSASTPGPTEKETEYQPEKDSCIPEIEEVSRKLTTQEYNALRAMELVKQLKWDFIRIAEHTGESVQFLRKVLIAAITLAICSKICPKKRDDVFWATASRLEFNSELMSVIRTGLMFEQMLAPVGNGIPEWLEDNLSTSDLETIASPVSTDARKVLPEDIPTVLLKGKLPEQRANYYSELPDKYKTYLVDMAPQLRNMRDDVKKGMIRHNCLSEFIGLFNKDLGIAYQINDAIKESVRRGYL